MSDMDPCADFMCGVCVEFGAVVFGILGHTSFIDDIGY